VIQVTIAMLISSFDAEEIVPSVQARSHRAKSGIAPLEWRPCAASATMTDADRDIFALVQRVGRRLVKAGWSVTTAESCTGGWIAKALTEVAGSSQWFGEGFVTYSNEAKVRTLGVKRALLKSQGAVSEAVARAMARGALARTRATIAVAVTGIAGPDGGMPGKPVGTVWFCWADARGPQVRFRVERKRFRGNREAVRRSTVRWALKRLLRR
jgi:nicotinamide-nucleotide amidase